MANLVAHSPLQGRQLNRATFQVEEATDFALIRLQTFARQPGLMDEVAARLDLLLPEPGAVRSQGVIHICWSAPGEWVIAVPAGSEHQQLAQLRVQLQDLLAVVTLMTDARVMLLLGGTSWREVLARGSSVDFAPAAFGPRSVVTTKLAGVAVMLARLNDDPDAVTLMACRSVAGYLSDWLEAASIDC